MYIHTHACVCVRVLLYEYRIYLKEYQTYKCVCVCHNFLKNENMLVCVYVCSPAYFLVSLFSIYTIEDLHLGTNICYVYICGIYVLERVPVCVRENEWEKVTILFHRTVYWLNIYIYLKIDRIEFPWELFSLFRSSKLRSNRRDFLPWHKK